jgi:hypothetical protein
MPSAKYYLLECGSDVKTHCTSFAKKGLRDTLSSSSKSSFSSVHPQQRSPAVKHHNYNYSHLESRLTLSASSPILFIHLSTSSLFSLSSFSLLCSAKLNCNSSATISSCACSTILLLPLSSSSRSCSFLSVSRTCFVRLVIWFCEERCCVERAESCAVRSDSWVCRVERAFCVVAKSVRRVERRSEGVCEGSLLLVGVPVRSWEAGLWVCGLGGTVVAEGCGCCESCAVRSARAVSVHMFSMCRLLL